MPSNRLKDLVDRHILVPLAAFFRIVARAGAMQAQEADKTGHAQFAPQHVQGMALELFVRELVGRGHSRCSFQQDNGFLTRIFGLRE
jgi:hypothetical protein